MYATVWNCFGTKSLPASHLRRPHAQMSMDPLPSRSDFTHTSDPEFWGAAAWRFLHVGAAYVPEQVPRDQSRRLQGFLLGLPDMVACPTCQNHARAFVDAHKDELPSITRTRTNLFRFLVDFHNYVNKRQGKRLMSYKEAWELWSRTPGIVHS